MRASGYIVNQFPSTVDIDELKYETVDRAFLAIRAGKGYLLDINDVWYQALVRRVIAGIIIQGVRGWSGCPSGWPSSVLHSPIHAGLSIRLIAITATIRR